MLRRKLVPDLIEVDLPSDTDDDSDVSGSADLDLYPRYAAMQESTFLHTKITPKNGKYGDPAATDLWRAYVEDFKRGDEIPDDLKQAGRGSTAGDRATKPMNESGVPLRLTSQKAPNPSAVAGTLDPASSRSPPIAPNGHRKSTGRWEAKHSLQLSLQRENKPVRKDAFRVDFVASKIRKSEDEFGVLDLTEASWKGYWRDEAGRPKLKWPDSEEGILFPIFCPSAGRPKTARLHLSEPMDGASYVQLVCVKPSELDTYKEANPNLDFFVLPRSAEKLGIGASRMWIMQLAQIVCPEE